LAILPIPRGILMNKREQYRRAEWFRAYEAAVQKRPDYAANGGRICWDTAAHFLNTGKDATTAAIEAECPYLGGK
jgi:hypothetical protein